MNISLKFDCHSCTIYIPDGYITNIIEIQNQFFEWVSEQSSCLTEDNAGRVAVKYNEKDFLKYINEQILIDSREKAYIISGTNKTKGKMFTLLF
ncbi:MAG: hypothetical protein E7269_07890 [Lachnospiraceae bacterium]|nr:hypothetical protein [Lachnospiraceae bacterium]